MQFNGANGCPTCLSPGVWDSSRYYLPDAKYPTRTNSSINKAASDASSKVVHGIKGKVDLVYDVPIDYMHLRVGRGCAMACGVLVWFF